MSLGWACPSKCPRDSVSLQAPGLVFSVGSLLSVLRWFLTRTVSLRFPHTAYDFAGWDCVWEGCLDPTMFLRSPEFCGVSNRDVG